MNGWLCVNVWVNKWNKQISCKELNRQNPHSPPINQSTSGWRSIARTMEVLIIALEVVGWNMNWPRNIDVQYGTSYKYFKDINEEIKWREMY